MARIEGIRIRGYRALEDVTLGKLWNTPRTEPLTPITAVIGPNGVGKSSLLDALGFLADCLKLGVEEACDVQGRGGFSRVRSQGRRRPIEFALYFREHARAVRSPTNWPLMRTSPDVRSYGGSGCASDGCSSGVDVRSPS